MESVHSPDSGRAASAGGARALDPTARGQAASVPSTNRHLPAPEGAPVACPGAPSGPVPGGAPVRRRAPRAKPFPPDPRAEGVGPPRAVLARAARGAGPARVRGDEPGAEAARRALHLSRVMRRLTGLAAILALGSCSNPGSHALQGYAEGEYVKVATPFAGQLLRLSVKHGDHVKSGDPLFALEQANEAAARREAADRLARAQAQVDNLRKAKRVTEIEAVRAELAQAEADLKLAEANLKRQEELFRQNFISRERVDDMRTPLARRSPRPIGGSSRRRSARRRTRSSRKRCSSWANGCPRAPRSSACCRRETSRCAFSCPRANSGRCGWARRG